jgi:hypothetical protein
MGLCGSFRCGCGVTSTPATTGAINGELPSIFVSGSGEPGDPYDLSLNDAWAAGVADAIVPTAWTTPAFVNGWSSMTAGAAFAYRRVGTRVEMRGGVAGGTVGATVPILTLPVGFRPNISAAQLRFFATVSNGAIATVYVYGDGSVTLAGGSNAGLSLETVTFDTA